MDCKKRQKSGEVSLWDAGSLPTPNDPCLLFLHPCFIPSPEYGWNKWLDSTKQNVAQVMGPCLQDQVIKRLWCLSWASCFPALLTLRKPFIMSQGSTAVKPTWWGTAGAWAQMLILHLCRGFKWVCSPGRQLDCNFWEILSQKPWAKPLLISDPRELWNNKYCFMLLFGGNVLYSNRQLGHKLDCQWQFTHCCSVSHSCLTFCNRMDCSTPGFPLLHYLPDFAQTRVHWVYDAIQSPHPPSPASPPDFNLSQHRGSFPMSWLFSLGGQSLHTVTWFKKTLPYIIFHLPPLAYWKLKILSL